MAYMSKQTKSDVQAYGLWRSLAAEDEMRCQWEHRMQECMDLHNQHVLVFHQRGYYTCADAYRHKAEILNLV